jgi:acetyl-CoA carboxylase biotin carboxylase subunit
MSFGQDDLSVNGHAIEVRINAEKLPNFSPCPGRITQYHAPGGLGIRMDSALYDGYSIPPYYDSLIAKLIVHGRDRPEALARLNRALGELIVDGIDTTVPLFHALLAGTRHPARAITRSTGWKTGFRATWADLGPPAKNNPE